MSVSGYCGNGYQPLSPANGEEPTTCENMTALHGLLSRAQFQCGYNDYNGTVIDIVRHCNNNELGENRTREILEFGMREFDRHEREKGHTKICNELLEAYPKIVRN